MQLVLGLTQLPLLGLLIVLSVPGLTAGLLEAFAVTAQGGQPALRLLFTPLASGRHVGRLLAMGAVVFAVGVLCISAMLSGNEQLMDPDVLTRIEQGDIDAMAALNHESLARMAMAFLVGISISGTLSYFTIPLIWVPRSAWASRPCWSTGSHSWRLGSRCYCCSCQLPWSAGCCSAWFPPAGWHRPSSWG
jgi:hypothetical protein